MFQRIILALALILCVVSPVLADNYASDYENVFSVATDMNWPVASSTSFGFAAEGPGVWGNSWGINNGRLSVYSGGAIGNYRSVYVQSNSGFFRTMILSATPTKFKIRLGPPSATPVDQKFAVWGLMNTTSATSQFAIGGAGRCTCFRLDAGGSAGTIEVVTKNGASETVTSTGVVDAAGVDHTAEIIATSTQVLYYLDGTLIATHTTNIPTATPLGAVFGIRTKVAAMRVFEPDWLKFEGPR